MATEIERKFLIKNESWRQKIQRSVPMRQAYLANTAQASIRIRIAKDVAHLNIKSAVSAIVRDEYEYQIPMDDAEEMFMQLCLPGRISKTRHYVEHSDEIWEIDEFHDENAGLIVAESELNEAKQAFPRPSWLGAEVSHLERYYNHLLINMPYGRWSDITRREV